MNASELTPGDIVYTKDWGTATVNSVNLLELEEPVEVFNFEVEDCHTYFVDDGFFLVHNTCGSTSTAELSDDSLRNIGTKGKNSGFRAVNGTHDDAMNFFKSQTRGSITENSPGKFLGTNSRGAQFRIYPKPIDNYTSIRINGISGLKGIKFLWP